MPAPQKVIFSCGMGILPVPQEHYFCSDWDAPDINYSLRSSKNTYVEIAGEAGEQGEQGEQRERRIGNLLAGRE